MKNKLVVTTPLNFLERLPSGSADLVFLDPPRATREIDFIPQALPELALDGQLDEYLHWLSHMLQQVQRVLDEDGVLFLVTGAFNAGYSRVLADRVFGRDRFATQVVVPRPGTPERDNVRADHELVLVYCKGDRSALRAPSRRMTDDEVERAYPESDAGGRYRAMDLTRQGRGTANRFIWNGIQLPPGCAWRYTRHAMDRLAEYGHVHVPTGGLPRLKVYMDDDKVPLGSIWEDMRYALHSEDETWPERHAIAALGRRPVALLERIIEMGSAPGDHVVVPGDISGNAITAAARMGRRWTGSVNIPFLAGVVSARLKRHGRSPKKECLVLEEAEFETDFPHPERRYRNLSTGMYGPHAHSFRRGEPIPFHEDRWTEFKAVKSRTPSKAIGNAADEYAAAFLNREGGRILWGIRDDGIVDGVRLDRAERDRAAKLVTDKLHQISPPITPNQFAIHFYPVLCEESPDPDLWIVELRLERGDPKELYRTGGGRYFMRTDSGKKLLDERPLAEEILRRNGAPPGG